MVNSKDLTIPAIHFSWIRHTIGLRTSLTLISPRYYTQKLDGIMSLINEKATDLRAAKFLAAAQYGSIARDVAKCEHRYQCAMDLEIIKTVF